MKFFRNHLKAMILFIIILLLYLFTIKYGLDLINNDYESAKKVLGFFGLENYHYMFLYYSIFGLMIYIFILFKYSDNLTVRILLPSYQALLWGMYLRSDYNYLVIYNRSTMDYYREIGYNVNPIMYRANITLISIILLSFILFQIKNPVLKKIIYIGVIAFSIYMLINFKWTLTAIFYDH